jgi:hypothetical protein
MASWKVIVAVGFALAFGGCYAAGVVLELTDKSSNTPVTPSATPTESPDHKFKGDMDDAFGAEMNPGNPAPWNHRFFTDHVIKTGHEICGYLGSHSYADTAQQFKLRLPIGYPSDSDAYKFVDIAIDDLCPEYSSMTKSPPPSASSATQTVPGTSDEELYGRLAADAHAQGIPGGLAEIGTLAVATCSVAAGSTSLSDALAILRDNSPELLPLLRSWTRAQARTFADLAIADGICMPGTKPGLYLTAQ